MCIPKKNTRDGEEPEKAATPVDGADSTDSDASSSEKVEVEERGGGGVPDKTSAESGKGGGGDGGAPDKTSAESGKGGGGDGGAPDKTSAKSGKGGGGGGGAPDKTSAKSGKGGGGGGGAPDKTSAKSGKGGGGGGGAPDKTSAESGKGGGGGGGAPDKTSAESGKGGGGGGGAKNSMKGVKNPKGNVVVEKWVNRTLDMGVQKLTKEFRELAKWTPEDMTLEAFNANKDKNRYQDIPCQDKNRIVLKFPGLASDYIHANFLGTASDAKRFICAQGPLENTQHSFWALAIQEKVECVIMLCNCIEMTKIKCHQYWPPTVGEKMSFGEAPNQIHVTNQGMNKLSAEDSCINVTTIKVEWADGNRVIKHFQWENWPDRGVPQTKLTAINLLSSVRGSKFPVLVHCSAGIGRTGTIVAIAYVQDKMKAGEDCMAMNELLKELRRQRPWVIQNESQYLYLHRVLLAYFLEKYSNLFAGVLGADGEAKYKKWCEDYKAATGAD